MKVLNQDNIYTFILKLDLNELYKHSYCVQAIFRVLPKLGQQFIMQMLFLDFTKYEGADMNLLNKLALGSDKDQNIALAYLNKFQITAYTSEDRMFIRMHPEFQRTLRNLVSKVEKLNDKLVCEHITDGPSYADLEQYAKAQWEKVLQYMVGNTTALDPNYDREISALLGLTNLIRVDGDTVSITTNAGFQFLLQDTKTQAWHLLKNYLNTCKRRSQNILEVVEFLFQLSFMKPGKAYDSRMLTHSQRQFIVDMGSFGILKSRKGTSIFFPSPLAHGLVTVSEDLEQRFDWGVEGIDGYIIVETNYRVYAYTSSELQIRLLSLFVELHCELPNLVSGSITRDSIRKALLNGITSKQILEYLTMHAHPKCKDKLPFVPATVTRQIQLWERERDRLHPIRTTMFRDFSTYGDYKKVKVFAEQNNWLLYSSEKKLHLLVHHNGEKVVTEFIKTNRLR